MLEREFQAKLIRRIKDALPDCFVLKNDANYIQGFPDLLILYNDRWAVLEVKESRYAPYRENQEYYLDVLNSMSYATTIYPENEEAVLGMLAAHFFEEN